MVLSRLLRPIVPDIERCWVSGEAIFFWKIKMIKFKPTNAIEVFVNKNNRIAIKEFDPYYQEEKIIELTLEQFSTIISCSEELIMQLEEAELDNHAKD